MATQAPLNVNNGRADALLCFATELLALLDGAGTFAHAGLSYQSVLGYAPEVLPGAAWYDYIHPEDREMAQRAFARVVAQPTAAVSVTYRHRHADDSWRTLDATLQNRLDDPALAGIVHVAHTRADPALVGSSHQERVAQPTAVADAAVPADSVPAGDQPGGRLDAFQAAPTSAPARLQALQAVTDAALAHLDRDALLRQVLDCITQILHVDNTAILLLDESTQHLVLHVVQGPEEEVRGRVRVPLGQGIAGRIAATGEPLIVDDLSQAKPVNPFLRERLHSLMGVPLRAKDRIIGVLHVSTLTAHRFTTEDLQWLQLVGDRVALAIDHADLYEAERAARAQERRQADQLAAIFEAIADPIMVYDRDGQLVQANPAAHTLNQRIDQAGYMDRRYDERVRLSLPRDSTGRPLEPAELPTARVLRGERFIGADAVDLIISRLDGRDVLINISGAPIRDTQGQI